MTTSFMHDASQSREMRRQWMPAVKVVAALGVWFLLLACLMDLPNGLRWPARVIWIALGFWFVWITIAALRRTTFTLRKGVFILLVVGINYFLLSLACHVFIRLMSGRDDRLSSRGMTALPEPCKEGIRALIADDKFNVFSKEIGWVPRPGYVHTKAGFTINAQGARATREYPLPAPDVDKRILCVGDSFTFGVEVNDAESYPAHAEKMRPGTEWINLGIPGACLVQAYQRYLRDAPSFGGRHVVVGFMSNDAQRTVNAFRPFLNIDSGCPFTKPFAKFVNGSFSIEPNPFSSIDDFKSLLADEATGLAKLAEVDYVAWSSAGRGQPRGAISRTLIYVWEARQLDRNFHMMMDSRLPLASWIKSRVPSDPYGRSIWSADSPGFKAVTGMFERCRQKIIADGREPLFVLMPGASDVQDALRHFPCQYTSLVGYLSHHGFPFIDFLPTLLARQNGRLTLEKVFVDVHYRGSVNRELAREIIHALKLP